MAVREQTERERVKNKKGEKVLPPPTSLSEEIALLGKAPASCNQSWLEPTSPGPPRENFPGSRKAFMLQAEPQWGLCRRDDSVTVAPLLLTSTLAGLSKGWEDGSVSELTLHPTYRMCSWTTRLDEWCLSKLLYEGALCHFVLCKSKADSYTCEKLRKITSPAQGRAVAILRLWICQVICFLE